MSLRKKIFILVSVGITITGILSCSKLNDSTNVGDEILTNSDPSLTSFDKNFLAFSGDSTQALEAFSIPDGSSYALFGIHSGMITLAGNGFDSAQSSTGYVKFLIDSTFEKNFKSGDSLLSITIQFDTLINNYEKSDPRNIRIQSCSNDSVSVRKTADPLAMYDDTLLMPRSGSDTSLMIDTISGKIKDSIFRACTSYVNRINKCGKDTNCDTIEMKPLSIAFNLFNTDPGICRLKNPAINIRCIRNDQGKIDTISQTVRSYYENYITYETDESKTSLSKMPVSSYSSGRIAVYKVNLKPLWDKIDSSKQANFNKILSASFLIKGQSQFSDKVIQLDTTKKDSATISYSVIKYGYFFSPTLIEDGYILNDSLFGNRRSDTITSGGTKLMPVEYLMRPLVGSDRPSFGYFYIGITSSTDLWNKVIWGKPVLKAVVTTLKR